jgi:UPF0716 family protein affecting phage T7 exclusion
MPFLIFFLMISWPVLEVASIIQVNRWVGPLATFLLLAGGFAFGAFLIRSHSRIVALRVMQAIRSGAPPEKPCGHPLYDSRFRFRCGGSALAVPTNTRSHLARPVLWVPKQAAGAAAIAARAANFAASGEASSGRRRDRRGIHGSSTRSAFRREQRQARRLALG